MVTNTYNTIIIGAGISGIGCATTLLKDHHNFRIISPDLGGRIVESENKTVEYGAYYIMGIYHKTTPFVKRGRKIKPTRLVFHKSKYSYSVFNLKLLSYLPQLLRLILILYKFKGHYEKFKKNSLLESQISCLKKDKYLWELYHSNALTFVAKNRLNGIVDAYLSEVLHATTFTPLKELNAFTFLQFSLPLIVPVYEFSFKKEEVANHLGPHLIKDTVKSINYKNKKYSILTTKSKKLLCQNLVVATPPHISKKLLSFTQPLRKPASAHMFHIVGDLKPGWNKGDENVAEERNKLITIARQKDGSYLLYTKEAHPNLRKYCCNFKIITHKYWNPAFHIGGSNLLDFVHGKNLFVIGDNNICGLEDSYIYGMYAANKILGKTRD